MVGRTAHRRVTWWAQTGKGKQGNVLNLAPRTVYKPAQAAVALRLRLSIRPCQRQAKPLHAHTSRAAVRHHSASGTAPPPETLSTCHKPPSFGLPITTLSPQHLYAQTPALPTCSSHTPRTPPIMARLQKLAARAHHQLPPYATTAFTTSPGGGGGCLLWKRTPSPHQQPTSMSFRCAFISPRAHPSPPIALPHTHHLTHQPSSHLCSHHPNVPPQPHHLRCCRGALQDPARACERVPRRQTHECAAQLQQCRRQRGSDNVAGAGAL